MSVKAESGGGLEGLTLVCVVPGLQLHLTRVRLQQHQTTLQLLLFFILGVLQDNVPLEKREREQALNPESSRTMYLWRGGEREQALNPLSEASRTIYLWRGREHSTHRLSCAT